MSGRKGKGDLRWINKKIKKFRNFLFSMRARNRQAINKIQKNISLKWINYRDNM